MKKIAGWIVLFEPLNPLGTSEAMFSVSPPIRRPAAAWSLHALEALESRHMMHSGAFPTITIETNAGDITLNMFDERAPQTVQNFLVTLQTADKL